MTKTAKSIYAEAFKENFQKTIEELEVATRDPTYKKSLFEPGVVKMDTNMVAFTQDLQSHPHTGPYDQRSVTSNPNEHIQPFPEPAGGEESPLGRTNPMVAAVGNSELPRISRSQFDRRQERRSSNGYSTRDDYIPRRNNYSRSYNYSPKSQKRREAMFKWQDWACKECKKQNSGRFYKCLYCEGQATNRQIPQDSWQCKCITGRNTWKGLTSWPLVGSPEH